MELSIKQKELLGQFFGNLAVAWIAGGIIGPFVINWNVDGVDRVIYVSAVAAIIFVGIMLYLVKEDING